MVPGPYKLTDIFLFSEQFLELRDSIGLLVEKYDEKFFELSHFHCFFFEDTPEEGDESALPEFDFCFFPGLSFALLTLRELAEMLDALDGGDEAEVLEKGDAGVEGQGGVVGQFNQLLQDGSAFVILGVGVAAEGVPAVEVFLVEIRVVLHFEF
jgi:hypothetical protein